MTHHTELPKLPLTSSTSASPFSSSVAFNEIADFVNARYQGTAIDGSWGVLFVISEDLHQLSMSLSTPINSLMLIDDSIPYSDIDRRVIFVARGGPAAIVSAPHASLSDARKFICANKLENTPTVLLHTAREQWLFRFLDDGLAATRKAFTTPVGSTFGIAAFNDLASALDWVDDNGVCPAINIDTLWQIPDKHVPHGNAEKLVQKLLINGLSVSLGKDFVINEASVSAGRVDILILAPKLGMKIAFIELKVIKSFHSVKDVEHDKPNRIADATNRKWAFSAVRQAAAYRGRQNPDAAAYARVYDMRKDTTKAIPDAVTLKAAAKHSVIFGIRKLYPTTAEIQAAAAA